MTNSDKFKLAHQVAWLTVQDGDNYRATFAASLRLVNRDIIAAELIVAVWDNRDGKKLDEFYVTDFSGSGKWATAEINYSGSAAIIGIVRAQLEKITGRPVFARDNGTIGYKNNRQAQESTGGYYGQTGDDEYDRQKNDRRFWNEIGC